MKLLLRCAIAAFVLLAVSAIGAVLGFNVALAAIAWPGIMVMNAVLAWLGIYMHGSESMWPWLVPGLLIDFVGYTVLFFVLAKVRRLLPGLGGRRSASPRS